MSQISLTIVICTFNRADLLKECLHSLVEQTYDHDTFEILVVNNASTDHTEFVVNEMQEVLPNLRQVLEPTPGLSNARNKGWEVSTTNWINYLDDDAKAHSNFVEKIFYTIKNCNFDCFGGVFLPWYKYGSSIWFPYHAGTNSDVQDFLGELPNDKYASGGNFTIKWELIKRMKGFNPGLGMNGEKIAYGEEVELQINLRKGGYTIGFNPEIKIDHLVARNKLSLWWWCKSFYSRSRYRSISEGKTTSSLLKTVLRLGVTTVRTTFGSLRKLFVISDYKLNHALVDLIKENIFVLGMYSRKTNKGH